jgi:CSLREA domain-containing protein
MRYTLRPAKLRKLAKTVQLELLEDRRLLSVITVNTTADDSTPDATLSLREAIEVSNGTLPVASLSAQEQAQVSGAVGSSNTIDFNIPTTDSGYNATTGVWRMDPNPTLPTISTNAAIINGYSQPGASKNTLAQGDNAKLAIVLDGSKSGGYGLTLDQQGSQVLGLDIENFSKAGVLITGTQIQVTGCFIGTDSTGETAASNGTAVELDNSSNTIGGPNVADRNVLSGSMGLGVHFWANSGVYVPSQALNPLNIAPTGNVVENNLIGVDASGTKALGNEYAGVEDMSSGNTYGGTGAGLGNVISGNREIGVDSLSSITLEGNFIGTDATGKVALGNGTGGGTGIQNLEASTGTSISTIISNNLISGNSTALRLSQTVGSQSSYTIDNNLIGTDVTGTTAMGGSGIGLDLYSIENATVQNNVISAFNIGIRMQNTIASTESQQDVIQGNKIGTDKTGQVALGNTLHGIEIQNGTGITIGGTGPGQGNVIANNGYYGILLEAGQQVQFTRNTIFNNAKGGISRGYGTNGFTGAPIMTFTPGTGGDGILSGTIVEAKNSSYVVEIFSNPTSVGNEGQSFVKELTVTTDGTGHGSFSLTEPAGFYTATTTDSLGNSSEYSAVAGTVAASNTSVFSSANPSAPGQQVTFTAVVTAPSYQGTPTGTVTFTIDGVDEPPIPLSVVGGNDEATFATKTLTAGSHTVSAAYSGDANVGPSSGSLATQAVNAPGLATTTTALTSSLNPATVGQSVTFTAVVTVPGSSQTATGTVTFTIDGVAQTPAALAIVGGSDRAQFSTSALSAGHHTISAAYSGDSSANPSTASTLTQTVNNKVLESTTTVLKATPSPSAFGQSVVFTATVGAGAGGSPGGVVTFLDGTTTIGHGTVGAGGVATLRDSSLSVGAHAITAFYGGDAKYAQSTSTALTHTVADRSTAAPTVVSLQRFGFHMQPTSLVLTFSTALDAASVRHLANYRIVTLGGPGRGGSKVGHVTRVKRAIYDPSTYTVTLLPADRLDIHNRYKLTVNGSTATGLKGAGGLMLDGDSDAPGSNYVAQINLQTLAGPAPGWIVPGSRGASHHQTHTVSSKVSAAAVDHLSTSGKLSTARPLHRA